MARRSDYYLAEYKSLRDEIARTQKEHSQLEVLSIAGCMTFYAWLATNYQPSEMWSAAWFLPALIPPLGYLRSQALSRRIHVIAQYFRDELEPGFVRGGTPCGWENFVYEVRHGKRKTVIKRGGFGVYHACFWGAFFIMTVVLKYFSSQIVWPRK